MPIDWGADPSATGGSGEPLPHRALDVLEAHVDALLHVDPADRDARSIADDLVRLEGLLARLASYQVACVEVMQRRGDAEVLGARSTQAWLRSAARMAPGAAKALVALATRMGACPGTRDALSAGRITLRHAEVLARTIEELAPHLAGAVASVESELVDYAERVDSLRLSDACRRLRLAAAPEQATADDWVAFQQRRLSVSRTFAGLAAVDGVLDPVSAETVMTAIHAFSAPAGADDARTPGQRRADALTEICRRVLHTGDAPTAAGERPHISVTVPLAALLAGDGKNAGMRGDIGLHGHGMDGSTGLAGGGARAIVDPHAIGDAHAAANAYAIGELSWAGPISAELVRRIACDASVTRIVLGPGSQPLDVGRTTRVVPSGIRKALLLRDRTCRYPDCHIPGVWCDAHHIRHWARGGHTSLTNLILLCAYHHARLHLTGEWITVRPDGTAEVTHDPGTDHREGHGPAP